MTKLAGVLAIVNKSDCKIVNHQLFVTQRKAKLTNHLFAMHVKVWAVMVNLSEDILDNKNHISRVGQIRTPSQISFLYPSYWQ